MKYKNFYLFVILFFIIFQFVNAGDEKTDVSFTKPAPAEHKLGIGTEGVLNLAKELNLTDEQIAKIKEIKNKSKKDIFDLRNEIITIIQNIQDELKKQNADKNKINGLVDKISDNQKKLMKLRLEQFFEVKKILTDEQFEKLTKLLEERKKEFKKRLFKKYKPEE
jgi:Spy/CpxP family protein refolding chaperone